MSGAELLAALTRLGLKQSDVARTLGVRPETVNRWIKHDTKPHRHLAKQLERWLKREERKRNAQQQ